jgi:hypothetical protein
MPKGIYLSISKKTRAILKQDSIGALFLFCEIDVAVWKVTGYNSGVLKYVRLGNAIVLAFFS